MGFAFRHPLIVAPMAGGPTTPELVAASSRAGALGSVGAAYLSPAAITEFINRVRSMTTEPIGVNLFVPAPPVAPSVDEISRATAACAPFRDRFGLVAPPVLPPFEENFDDQFEAVLAAKPYVFSTTFGLLAREYVRAAQSRGALVMGTATTIDEALAQEDAGCDAVVLQGIEAGGHRGIFDARAEDPCVPAFELLRAARGRLRKPYVAAGGLMNRSLITEALKLGAAAVQMGTAFLLCREAGTSAPYRARLGGDRRETRTTRAFSGRLARGVPNQFMDEVREILPYPAQNKFTRDIRNACAKAGSSECLALWSGSGDGEISKASCAEIIESLFERD